MRPFNYFDPRTGQLLSRPQSPQGLLLGPQPMRSRRRGLGDIPNSSGAAGPLTDPYTETDGIFNPGSTNSSVAPSADTTSTGATASPSQTGYLPPSIPYGESDRPWTNPTTFATVPITPQTSISLPVLSQNFRRNALIIQNLSTATAPDTAPVIYIGFNAQPLVGGSLGLAPGQGIAWDIICPRDSIYIAFGPFVDTGFTLVIQGSITQGTYSP